jgi:hypothetical protein
MAVRVETIVDQKCGNQSTHLLSLLHREVTADILISPVGSLVGKYFLNALKRRREESFRGML